MSKEVNKGMGRTAKSSEKTDEIKGRNFLFVIGIDQYKDFPRLYNAVKDARDFLELMTTRFQFGKEDTVTLFDEEATAANIFKQLMELTQKAGPQDSLLIYFSGHGEYDQVLDKGFWIPYDGKNDEPWSNMDFSRIKDYIKPIKSLHTFIIADSCYSGTLFSERSKAEKPLPRDYFIPSRYLLTAGRNEVVSDGKPGDNSPFADSLMWHLRNDPGPQISVVDLCEAVKKDVMSNVEQVPRFGSVHGIGDRGGMFYFMEKGFTLVKEKVSSADRERPLLHRSSEAGKEKETTPVIRSFKDVVAALKKNMALRDFEATFQLIDQYLKTDSRAYNDWIFQQGRYNGILNQQRKGLIDTDFAQRQYNQIAEALVYHIDRIKEEDISIPQPDVPEDQGNGEFEKGLFWEKIHQLDLESLKRQATSWKEKIAFLEEEEPLTVDPNQRFALKKRLDEARQKYNALLKTIEEKE